MGACLSSLHPNQTKTRPVVSAGGAPPPPPNKHSASSSSSPKVVHMDGRIQEFKPPIQAKHITSQNPDHFLCNSENMSIGTSVPAVPGDEELQSDQIYFLLPLSHFNKSLSLPDLCALAVKASYGATDGNSKLILR